MQSHASRHVVSEHLKDRHPDLSAPVLKDVVTDEIAVAYGRKSIPKLVAVLALAQGDLADDQRAHALRVLLGLLTTQEHKTDTVHENGTLALTLLASTNPSDEVRKLSCQCLGSLAQVRSGRQAIVEANGITALTGALQTTPEAAAYALEVVGGSIDGISYLVNSQDSVVPALVTLLQQPPSANSSTHVSLSACQHAVGALAGVASTDAGVDACLQHHVPAALVHLTKRCISGDCKFDEGLMPAVQAVLGCMQQIARHADGKTALRLAGAIHDHVLPCGGSSKQIPQCSETVKHNTTQLHQHQLAEVGQLLTLCAWHPASLLTASAALMGMSVEKDNKLPIIQHAGKQLVDLLQNSKDTQLVSNVRAGLMSCCEHLEARALVQELLSQEDLVHLVYKGPLPSTPPDFRCKVTLPLRG